MNQSSPRKPLWAPARIVLLLSAAACALWAAVFVSPPAWTILLAAAASIALAARIPRRAEPRARWRAAVLFAAIVVCLAVLELVARLLVPPSDAGPIPYEPNNLACVFAPDPQLGFRLAPNSRATCRTDEIDFEYVISDQGLRGEHIGPKLEGTFRVVCLGDSFTMGHGVSLDETWVKQLERGLAAAGIGDAVECVNMGVNGYGVWQEALLLREQGLPFEPDLVILQLYPCNDVRDELSRAGKTLRAYDPYFYNGPGKRVRDNLAVGYRRVPNVLRRQSRLCWVFESRVWPRINGSFPPTRFAYPPPPAPENRPYWAEVDLFDYYPEIDAGWSMLRETLGDLAGTCRMRGVPLLAFSIPHQYEVYADEFPQYILDNRYTRAEYDLAKSNTFTEEACRQLGIPFVNLLPPFSEASAAAPRLYYRNDGHLTPRGQAVVADALAKHVLEQHGSSR